VNERDCVTVLTSGSERDPTCNGGVTVIPLSARFEDPEPLHAASPTTSRHAATATSRP